MIYQLQEQWCGRRLFKIRPGALKQGIFWLDGLIKEASATR